VDGSLFDDHRGYQMVHFYIIKHKKAAYKFEANKMPVGWLVVK
jgi:hypothetical protein